MAKKAGRKSKYDELKVAEKLDSVKGWAKHGGAKAVAKMLGVSNATVSGWKGKYPEFSAALAVAEKEANGQLLATAFDLATGYEREVNEVIKIRKTGYDDRGNKVTVEEEKVVTYSKYFPPSPQMTQFMLQNRFRDEYQKSPEPESADETNITVVANVPRAEM